MLSHSFIVLPGLLSLSFALPNPIVPSGIRIPLTKRSTAALTDDRGVVNVTRLHSQVHRAVGKHILGSQLFEANTGEPILAAGTKLTKRQQEALIDEQGESLWAGYITIGSDNQQFLIDFDTGSADLWCSGFNTDSSGSSNVVDQSDSAFTISYGDGSTASGPIYTDDVTVGGLTAFGQTFSPVSQESGFTGSPTAGIAGMAYQAISSLNAPPFFSTLVSQNAVSTPQFSFNLAPSGSELFLGGVDPRFTNPIEYTPVTRQGFWQVTGTVYANGQAVIKNEDLVIDTGTTLIVAPPQSAAAFFAKVPGARSASDVGTGYYSFPCAAKLNVAFSFDGSDTLHTIPPAFLSLGQVSPGSSRCIASIVGEDTGTNSWIVGDVFLRSVLAVFDLGQNAVGFAAQQ